MDHNYYTLQVVLHRKQPGTDAHEVIELTDCNAARIKELRDMVWTKGLRVQITAICWEIISPFAVKSVLIIKQDKKYLP